MKILGIDTSCDDTSAAIIEASGSKQKPEFNILSNVVSSQIKVHKKWGGVVPMLAKREHQRNLVFVLKKALLGAGLLNPKSPPSPFGLPPSLKLRRTGRRTSKISASAIRATADKQNLKNILKREERLFERSETFLTKYGKPEVDLIAITVGPGLEPCLWVGVNFARALAFWWDLPIVPVNHIEAHILANWLMPISENPKSEIRNPKLFPAICLVASGGHTQLILMKAIGKYELLGETRDDAAGECLDKTAKILGLGYPGGPAVAAEAAKFKVQGSKFKVELPRPMFYQKNYDFSFSGLKTAVLYDYKKRSPRERKTKSYIRAMCFETQQAIIDVLIHKTLEAAKERGAKTIILGGGVAANKELGEQFKKRVGKDPRRTSLIIPNPGLCTDNAAMVGAAGYGTKRRLD